MSGIPQLSKDYDYYLMLIEYKEATMYVVLSKDVLLNARGMYSNKRPLM